MKNKILIVAFAFMLFSCVQAPFPEETQEGNDTFGMYVNGKRWIQPAVLASTFPLTANYNPSLGLSIHASSTRQTMDLYIPDVVAPGDYYFDSKIDSIRYISYYTCLIKNCARPSPEDYYFLENKNESGLHLTKLDTVNKIVSGTFFLNLYNCEGDKLEITNGRFDAKYVKYGF